MGHEYYGTSDALDSSNRCNTYWKVLQWLAKKYTDQQKEEFFRLLERRGTVRAAARAVGVHENAGYNWFHTAKFVKYVAEQHVSNPMTTRSVFCVVEQFAWVPVPHDSAISVQVGPFDSLRKSTLGAHRPTPEFLRPLD